MLLVILQNIVILLCQYFFLAHFDLSIIETFSYSNFKHTCTIV